MNERNHILVVAATEAVVNVPGKCGLHGELIFFLIQTEPAIEPDSEAFNSFIGDGFQVSELKGNVRFIHFFPIFSFDAFKQRLTEGMPVVIHEGRTTSFSCNVVDIDMCRPRTPFLCSKRQFIWALPDHHLWASSAFVFQMVPLPWANFTGALIVNSCEFTQAVRETLSALLTQVLHNFLSSC